VQDRAVIAEKTAPDKPENERKQVAEAFRTCILAVVDELLEATEAELQRHNEQDVEGIDTDVNKANPVMNKNKRLREETPEQEDELFAPEFSPQRTAGER